ncbi:MAG: family 1 glycosylhydrolase [Streptosporangiaceae bacterium]
MRRTFVVLVGLLVSLLVPVSAEAGRGGFPPGFLWGVSVDGFEHEGSFPDSNWTRYARAGGSRDPYADSADFRHRYRSDLKLAHSLGVTTFRTSVEWARVEPRPGKYDWKEIHYYDDLVRRMRSYGMRPILELSHFVHPGWVADQGAWTNQRTVDQWLRFARFIVNRYKSDKKHKGEQAIWITFNEASYYILDELRNKGLTLAQVPTMQANLIKAHRAAYDMIHRVDPGAPVTASVAWSTILNPLFDDALFNHVTDKIDFIGLDYYLGSSLLNASVVLALTGEYWRIRPEPDGLYHVLRNYHRRFPKLPFFILENGANTDNGKPQADGYTRSQFIRDHLYWVQRAQQEGIRVLGYSYWSLIDGYEWGSYRPRFGLYTVNVRTDPALRRRPTPAAADYRAIIRRNGLPSGYRPVKPPAWCTVQDPLATCFGITPTPPLP